MLTQADNELICRVGPGTPMGDVMRRYWVPALLSEELQEPDGVPVRVRLLGENLIAFRETQGGIGLVANACPHRGASMFFGRNEESGLRCVYHGWKFDVEGNCVDMPNEPAESNFKHKIRIAAYPCYEKAGIVWAYLGPKDDMPEPPDYEWMRLDSRHLGMTKTFEDCNYLQGIEGGVDSSHSSFLHRNLASSDPTLGRGSYRARSTAPRLEVMYTDYGYTYASLRFLKEENLNYVRCYQFVMPFQQMRAGYVGIANHPTSMSRPAVQGHLWVPSDDYTHNIYNLIYAADGSEITDEEFSHELYMAGRGPNDYFPGTYKLKKNKANDWLVDREVQRTINYTGIIGVNTQDMAVQETMGGIYDRTKEHLGSADSAVIATRRLLLKAVRDVQAGKAPAGSQGEANNVRPVEDTIPVDVPWADHFQPGLVAKV